MNQDLMAYNLEIIYQKKFKKEHTVINLGEYENTGTHWIALFVKTNEVIYFDSFGIEHIRTKLINLLVIKILKVIYFDYKHLIQLCVDIIV